MLQLARSLAKTSFFGVPCYWFATGATGATARKEFSYDVIFLEYLATGLLQVLQVLQLAKSLAMTSFFGVPCYWFATGATGATARKEFSYDVIFLEYLATGLLQVLQVLQLARSLAMTSFFGVPCYWFATSATGATARKEFSYDVIFLEYLATGCYRCYSSQGV